MIMFFSFTLAKNTAKVDDTFILKKLMSLIIWNRGSTISAKVGTEEV